MKIVFLVSWMSLLEPEKDLQYLELFAGVGRLTRLAKGLGYNAEGHDILYDTEARTHGLNNSMDITGDAGFLFLVFRSSGNVLSEWICFTVTLNCIVVTADVFGLVIRLIVKAILESRYRGLLALVGLVCSSMVMVNAGTSQRDFLLPMGDPTQPSVLHSNLMASRQGLKKSLFVKF